LINDHSDDENCVSGVGSNESDACEEANSCMDHFISSSVREHPGSNAIMVDHTIPYCEDLMHTSTSNAATKVCSNGSDPSTGSVCPMVCEKSIPQLDETHVTGGMTSTHSRWAELAVSDDAQVGNEHSSEQEIACSETPMEVEARTCVNSNGSESKKTKNTNNRSQQLGSESCSMDTKNMLRHALISQGKAALREPIILTLNSTIS